jgi:hypothetical protein
LTRRRAFATKEFYDDVPAAFGYEFHCRDAVIFPWQRAAGAPTVDGREAETPLKALFDASYKDNAHCTAMREALRSAGVVPFDHPACFEPGAAPNGLKEETMLVSPKAWEQLSRCRCTADLKAWVEALQRDADAAASAAVDDADAA